MSIRRIITVAGLAAGLSLVAAGVAFAAGGAPRVATLTGAAEVPGPGDPDGDGFATVRLNHGQGTVCWEIDVNDITTPVAAHIHVGAAGVAGPVVVNFFTGGPPQLSGCLENVDQALIKAIQKNPENYYVNVHTLDFLAGAVRGQLSNAGGN